MKPNSYPKDMLPGIDYKQLEEGCLCDSVVDLEYETMQNLCDFVEVVKEALLQAQMIQIPELMVAHLCAYLGFLTVAGFGIQKASQLQSEIIKFLEKWANQAYKNFQRYPVNSTIPNKNQKKANLQTMREEMPSSIVVQTLRLGRCIFDAMEELSFNRNIKLGFSQEKQTELFCPQDIFIKLLKKNVLRHIKAWEKWSISRPILYAINQATIQIGWLMGYYSHMDKTEPVNYLNYGCPCVELYIDFGYKFLKVKHVKQF